MKFKTLLYLFEKYDKPSAYYSKVLWFLFQDQSWLSGMKKLRDLVDLETYHSRKIE